MFKLNLLGPLSINSYNMPILIGIVIFFVLALKNKDLTNYISKNDFIDLVTYTTISGIIFARILFVITETPNISFLEYFKIWEGGLSVLGSVIGGLFTVIGYCFYKNINIIKILDSALLYVPIIHIFGRIGCFFTGCCYGMTTNKLSFIGFDKHPTQLYSSFIFLIIFFILGSISKSTKIQGSILFSYLILASLERLFIDFFRDDRTFILGINILSVNQIIAFTIITLAIIFLFFSYFFNRLSYDRYF